MLPRMPSSSPASFARWVSGVTPMASSTMSERSGSLSSSSVSTESPSCRNPVTVSPNRRATPCLRISAWTKLAISVSSGANSCFGRWTMVTETPISTRFSAISRPIKPPPAKTAVFGFCSSTNRLMLRVSSTVRRVKTRSLSTPESAGTVGFAPGARSSLS